MQRPTGGSATSHLGRWDVAGGNAGQSFRIRNDNSSFEFLIFIQLQTVVIEDDRFN